MSANDLDRAAEILAETIHAVIDAYASRDAGRVLRAEAALEEAFGRFKMLLAESRRLREAEA